MANITEEHLHHMARRHHATMKQLDGIREKITGVTGRFIGTLETGIAAWLGGAFEGRSGGYSIGPVPINLLGGAVLLALGHLDLGPGGDKYSEHLNNLGNGLIGSWVAAEGYAFGKRWKDTGKMFGGGGHPFSHPYENGWAPPGASAAGDLSEAQMANIVSRMQAAAHAPAHP